MQVRVGVLTLVLLGTLFLSVQGSWVAAGSQPPPTPDISGTGPSIVGKAQRHMDDDTRERDDHRSSESGRSGPVAVSTTKVPAIYSQVRWDPTVQDACLHLETRMADPAEADALMSEVNAYDFAPILAPCTATASQPLPPVPSPGAAAQMMWRDQVKLPAPEPYIAPGKAITGLAAFLEIGGPRTRAQSFNVFGYALTINATATSYDVDWGDGTWSRGLTSAGGPWPDGDVRHVYTKMGTYTVRVIEHWSGAWSVAGGGGGEVAGTLNTEGVIPSFPVDQVQAVRNR